MKIAVTGTPGTGKTTATDLLETDDTTFDYDVVHLNELVHDEELTTGIDEERGSVVADLEAISNWLDDREDVVFESHLAHYFDADRVVVLRAHPEQITERLRERGERTATADENAESEALDVILTESVERHGTDVIYEIETTEITPEHVAQRIANVIAGEYEPSAGTVSYLEWL